MREWFIVGCGWLGTAFGRSRLQLGERVLATRRDLSLLAPEFSSVSFARGAAAALSDRESFAGVLFAAGPAGPSVAEYQAVYEDLLNELLDVPAISRSRLLVASSTAVIGDARGAWIDEGYAVPPASPTARVIYDAERRLASHHGSACALRFGGLYGPGRSTLLKTLILGQPSYTHQPKHFVNRVHLADCVGAMGHLFITGALAPELFVVDDEPASQLSVVTWLAEQYGLPTPIAREPRRPNNGSKRCSNARLKATGYRFRYPTFREGYAALAAELGLRRQG